MVKTGINSGPVVLEGGQDNRLQHRDHPTILEKCARFKASDIRQETKP